MSNLFGQSKTISWEWVDASGAIVDPITEKEIAKVSERFEPLTSPGRTAWRPAIHVVGRALAEMPLEKASPDDLPILLKALVSEDASTRRAARTAISTMPVSVVPELMQALKDGFDIYRIKLGLVVALTELLREEKSLASSISDALTADDIDLLVKAAGDMDRTVRIYATEFLYDLGDSRSVIPAITMAGETTDENARYNLLFLTQGGVQKLPKENRAVVEENLKTLSDRSGSETGKLIDQIVGHLQ